MPRHRRLRSLSDADLEEELILALVDDLTTQGVYVPGAHLQALYAAYMRRHRARIRSEGHFCTCWACLPYRAGEGIHDYDEEPF